MANHPLLCLLQYGGVWNDATADVSQNSPVRVTTGGTDIGLTIRPSQGELTFEDPTGKYRPYLPTSPLYGLAGRNTPIIIGDPIYTETFESAGLGVTVTSTSPNPWARSTTLPYAGSWCFKSGTTADSSFSDAIITPPAGANYCLMYYKADCAVGDILQILSGDTVFAAGTDVGNDWAQVLVPILNYGTNPGKLVIKYTKNASGSAGTDAGYVDQLQFFHTSSRMEVTEWAPDQTPGFRSSPRRGRSWTDITAHGLLDRLSAWTDPIQTAMTRTVLQFPTLVGFWPGEDDTGSLNISNLAPGGLNGRIVNAEFGASQAPGGGSTTIATHSNTTLSGTFSRKPAGNGWQVSRAMKITTALTATGQDTFTWRTTNGYTWSVAVASGSYTLNVKGADGVSLLSSASGYSTVGDPSQWVTLRVKASVSAGTVTAEIAWYKEGSPVYEGASPTFSGSVGALDSWSITGNSYVDGAFYGYIYGVSGTSSDLLGSVVKSFNGYVGETAAARFGRLMGEANLGWESSGSIYGNSQAMGKQKPDTLLNLLLELQETDQAIIFDRPNVLGAYLRTRQNLYRQTPVLALTFGVNVAVPLKPVLDTQNNWNQVTVTQRDGGKAVAQDDTSVMGTSSPPAGIGMIKQALDVNVADENQLLGIANWSLGLGTIPDTRYRSVVVDLDATPSLEVAAYSVRPGDRITISGVEPDLTDLIVVGIVDNREDQKTRKITYTCLPYRQYQVGIYDNTVLRYDADSSFVQGGGYNATATSIVFSSNDPNESWSTTAVPYVVKFKTGETATVTAMGAVSGTGPYVQTATVTRSTNGVVKALPAGTKITLAAPARYAL